jgi:hypothetical protein
LPNTGLGLPGRTRALGSGTMADNRLIWLMTYLAIRAPTRIDRKSCEFPNKRHKMADHYLDAIKTFLHKFVKRSK